MSAALPESAANTGNIPANTGNMPTNTALVPYDPRVAIDHPSGYLALSPRKQRFTVEGVPGFVAYCEQGRHLFSFGGVHAPAPAQATLLDRFLAEADRRRRRVIAVQLRAAQLELFRTRGFTVNKFGQSYSLDLRRFTLAGTPRMKLRNKIKRARTAGVRVVEVGRELGADAATFTRLDSISSQWLKAKRKKELDFMIGELGQPGDRERRIFAAVDGSERMLGFISYVPAFGERPGWLHDLTRRVPDAPVGTMELVNATALERLMAESNAQFLHFGFTPFFFDGDEPAGASRVLSWLLRKLARYGGFIYPARSQVEYKLKWAPEVIEPEFVACRPLSLRGIIDMLLLTRSI